MGVGGGVGWGWYHILLVNYFCLGEQKTVLGKSNSLDCISNPLLDYSKRVNYSYP